jgi:hypothetical protein
MTVISDVAIPAPVDAPQGRGGHRNSPIPTPGMISTRFRELRKRRGLMIALVVVNIGIPTIFLVVRLIAHAAAPNTYGPAGGYDIYSALSAGVIYIFGFVVAAALGCTAGSIDLTEGMFRHMVVTGRSRIAIYFARIPAGLAIVWTMVAAGFLIVCLVCVFAAPTSISYQGVNIPPGLSQSGFENWAANHAEIAVGCLPYNGPENIAVPCPLQGQGPVGGGKFVGPPGSITNPTQAQLRALAVTVARQNYQYYAKVFLYPSYWLMTRTGLWIELEATIGFIVGLGLGSLLGQRTIAVVLMIVLEIIITPLLSRNVISHLINGQRAVVGLATAHLEPGGLPLAFGGGGNGPFQNPQTLLVPETRTVAVCVIVAWLVGWTAIGAWRMATRDC